MLDIPAHHDSSYIIHQYLTLNSRLPRNRIVIISCPMRFQPVPGLAAFDGHAYVRGSWVMLLQGTVRGKTYLSPRFDKAKES